MGDDRFDRLTERQKQCVRLVGRGLEVKEIARALELSPNAVVERLRAARRILGVESSRDAARLLTSHEHPQAYIRHVDMPQPVAFAAYPLPPSAGSEAEASEPFRLQETSAPFVVLDSNPVLERPGWPRPWRGKGIRSNDLTALERLLASGGLTVAIAMGAAILLIAVIQLMSFLIQISRHGG